MEFGNISELIFDDVNVGNSNLRILTNDGRNVSRLLVASKLPKIQHKHGNGSNSNSKEIYSILKPTFIKVK